MHRLYESMAALSELGAASAEDALPLDDDRWELVTELGSGGMGRVLLMYDRWLEREVAVKEPHTPEAAERLAREARVTAGLTHPGVVTVHDVLKGADGMLRYVMPVAQGSSLAGHLALTPSAAERRRRFLRPRTHRSARANLTQLNPDHSRCTATCWNPRAGAAGHETRWLSHTAGPPP